jgi:hypothetical protein
VSNASSSEESKLVAIAACCASGFFGMASKSTLGANTGPGESSYHHQMVQIEQEPEMRTDTDETKRLIKIRFFRPSLAREVSTVAVRIATSRLFGSALMRLVASRSGGEHFERD